VQRRSALARSCAAATATDSGLRHSLTHRLPVRCGTCRVSSVSASCSSGSRKHTAQLARTLNVCARTRTHRSRTGTHVRAHTQTDPARGLAPLWDAARKQGRAALHREHCPTGQPALLVRFALRGHTASIRSITHVGSTKVVTASKDGTCVATYICMHV
jgi:hypothetical protein